ncbi:integrase core domain, partial [Paramuricea clavata]
MFLVVVDAYSKWLEVHLMTSTTSTTTIEKLREIFATHGLPATVVSDNGIEEFMKRNGIKHIKVSPYHPASNGQAERAVRIFKEGNEKMKEGNHLHIRTDVPQTTIASGLEDIQLPTREVNPLSWVNPAEPRKNPNLKREQNKEDNP